MTESKYNIIHSIFNNYVALQIVDNEDKKIDNGIVGSFIIFLKKNKEDFKLTDKDLTDYYQFYQYSINDNIRKIISTPLKNDTDINIIKNLYWMYNEIFKYLLTIKPYKDALYIFKSFEYTIFKNGNVFDKFVLAKELSNSNNILDQVKLIKLLRQNDNIIKSFINLEKGTKNE